MQIIYVISEFLIWIKVIRNQTNYLIPRMYSIQLWITWIQRFRILNQTKLNKHGHNAISLPFLNCSRINTLCKIKIFKRFKNCSCYQMKSDILLEVNSVHGAAWINCMKTIIRYTLCLIFLIIVMYYYKNKGMLGECKRSIRLISYPILFLKQHSLEIRCERVFSTKTGLSISLWKENNIWLLFFVDSYIVCGRNALPYLRRF